MNPMQIAGLGKIHLAQRRAINTFIKRYREDQNRKIRQKIKGRNRGGESGKHLLEKYWITIEARTIFGHEFKMIDR